MNEMNRSVYGTLPAALRKGGDYPYMQWGDHRLSVDRYGASNSSGLWERSLGGRDGRDVHGLLFVLFEILNV